MPTPNLLNPAGDPIVDERLRGVGQYMGEAAQDPLNLGKGLLSAALGFSGDVQEIGNQAGTGLLSLLSRQPVTGPLMSGLVNYQGRSAPTSRELGAELGADLDSPGYQVGEFGAPDLTDIARHSPTLAALFLHGSPHKWSKPATIEELARHMGSGEGAQAFGWGMYLAENPKVAGSYREALSDSRQVFKVDGKTVDIDSLEPTDPVDAMAIRSLGQPDLYNPETLPQRLLDDDADPAFVSRLSRRLEELKGRVNFEQEQFGHLYEVDIPDEAVDQMLDWDAPLSEQPEHILKAIRANPDVNRRLGVMVDSYGRDKVDGEAVYLAFSDVLGGDEKASRSLNQAGIPGIRFLDGDSRKAGEGTRNIVVFDPDSSIKSVKRDGELVWEVPKPKLSLRRDNPGGDWLRSERARAAETGNLGNITAYLYDDAGNRHVMLNPKDLVDIPGTMGEQASRGRGRKAADVREWMSRGEAMEHPIFITVDYRGRPKISEGNNRMAVAAELGLEEVPVEIRWYSGGEEIEGAWSPANVERRMRGEPIEVNQQSLDVVDEIDNERRESLRKEIQDLMDWLDEQVD